MFELFSNIYLCTEKKLAKKVGACKTPQDVLDLAVEIAGYHKEKKKKATGKQKKIKRILH